MSSAWDSSVPPRSARRHGRAPGRGRFFCLLATTFVGYDGRPVHSVSLARAGNPLLPSSRVSDNPQHGQGQ